MTSETAKSICPKNVASVEDGGRSLSNTSEISSKTLNLSLEDTIIIQGRIANFLGLKNKWSLVFLGASKGCVELKFSISMLLFRDLKSQLNITEVTELNPETGIARLEASGIYILCGPPGKPYASEVTDGSVTLKWTKPEYTGLHPLVSYHISYCQPTIDHPDKRIIANTEGPIESLVVKDLSNKGSAFIFTVQAVNKIGAGLESKESDLIILSTSPNYDFHSKLVSYC